MSLAEGLVLAEELIDNQILIKQGPEVEGRMAKVCVQALYSGCTELIARLKLLQGQSGDTPLGTVVRLRTFGPDMVVTEYKHDQVVCTWFDSNRTLQKESFPASGLRVVQKITVK